MMNFTPHTQKDLKTMAIKEGGLYLIEYLNKDYFNGEEIVEKANGTAIINEGSVYFNVTDAYGMDKLIMNFRIIEPLD